MRRVFSRRSAILLTGALAVLLGATVVATGSNSVSCDAEHGSTLLEDGSARVYSSGGHVYACTRPNGPAHALSKSGSAGAAGEVSDISLAGRFVAWKRFSVDQSLGRSEHALVLLDLGSGDSRVVVAIIGPASAPSAFSLGDHVLSQNGTLVWLVNSSACGHPCSVTSKLSDSRIGQHNSVLERVTNTGPSGGPVPHAPIGSLGLSRSGHVAYWITNGNFRGHHIP
jgi:hypothetical protein